MKLLPSLAVAAVVTLAPVAGWSTTVVVTPGPGTPLQDAINAAAPGTKLLLECGTFAEAIVISKALTLMPAPGERGCSLFGPRIDASSTNAAFAIDIVADDVQLKGQPFTSLELKGGSIGRIHVGARTGIRLTKLVIEYGPGVLGLVLDGTTGASITRNTFGAVSIANVPADARIRLMNNFISAGLSIQDSGLGTPLLGRGGIRVRMGPYSAIEDVNGDEPALVVTNSSGIFVSGVQPRTQSNVSCSRDGCTAISLDASSSLNRFNKLTIEARSPSGVEGVAVSDAGTGNCGDNITYLSGTGTFAPCP